MRLQTFLSHNGVCSRREALTVVQSGRVSVNGQLTKEPSTDINPSKDRVELDGNPVKHRKYEYILLNKPRGYVTTRRDKNATRTVLDLIPPKYRDLAPAGRLDQDTEGLLLLTNDGAVAHRLTHPRYSVGKEYFVRVEGRIAPDSRQKIERGIYLSEGKTAPAKIRLKKVTKAYSDVLMVIHEGKKRQIRRVFAKVGNKVIYLKRLSQGPLKLGGLKSGMFRMLTPKEIEALKNI